MSSLCIIGAGITGLSLLLLLQEAGADLSAVTIIDPHFDGGDLARRWGPVLSNTPWSKTLGALSAACPSLKIPEGYPLNSTSPLIEIAHLIRSLALPALKKVRQIQASVIALDSKESSWTVTYTAGGVEQSLQTRAIVLCQGSEPKTMNIPIPSIPLECALDPNRLRGFVKPGQRVLLFGTMHSGTLVMRNLKEAGAITTALYNTGQPFVFDRDGAYDGIKEEAAAIADAILRGDYAQTTLSPVKNTATVIRAALEASWVVYAMGFTTRKQIIFRVEGRPRDIAAYNGFTGAITDAPRAFGFGVAYPNVATTVTAVSSIPDDLHWDVSVAAFLTHMKAQLPRIRLAAAL
jgi:hypothetical protein